MKNLDQLQKERTEILQRMTDAVKENSTEGFSSAFDQLAELIQQNIIGEVREMQSTQDNGILAARGCRVLTSGEKQYYESVLEAMKSPVPQQALAGINTVLPETVIDAVFEDLKAEHPLLSAINFTNTGALVKILLSTTGGVAAWGTLDATITSELSASFTEVDLSLAKLTAFIPVNKYMIELGPQWIDNYVRQLLTEAIAVQLEVGIVAGSGKNQPIGMMKKLSGATDGVYPNKTAVVVTSLSPASYGAILDTLSTGPNSKRRAVQNVLLIVNPSDYFTKVFPATTVRATDGSYSKDVFPYPTSLIQSAAVPAGKAVFGLASKYFMGMGTQSGGKIEYSDEYKFLEQQRVYLTYLYGYGRAMDENAFVLADISGLVPVTQEVVVNEVKAVVKTKEQV
ncbi:MAG: phage major capsid protein [Oscillospiraceae bacterium]